MHKHTSRVLFARSLLNTINKTKHSAGEKIPISLISALALQACSSGKTTPPPPVPDFREDPSGTFTATSSKDNILNRPTDIRDLTVYGADGIDQITTGSGNDTIEGRGGNDTINGGEGDNIIDGGTGIDTITAGDGNNEIHGREGDDRIESGTGDDSLYGDAGNDTIISSGGADGVGGGDGNDIITLTGDGDDTIFGGYGDDVITASDTDDIIVGDFGNDTINAGGGVDYIWPHYDVDTTYAGAGDDYILVIGITEEDQFSEVDLITLSVLGLGDISLSLGTVLALAGINGRTVSELQPGEIIDGGEGTNTLIIYGDTDLSVATLNNLYEINIIEGTVGVSSVQIADFGAITSDENSTVNIIADENNLTLDLSTIDVTNLGELTVPDGMTLTMHDISDIEGISRITASGADGYTLKIIAPEGAGELDIALADLATTLTGASVIELGANVNLTIASVEDVALLGLTSITGVGDVIFDNASLTLDELAQLAADLVLDGGLVLIGFLSAPSPMFAETSMQLNFQTNQEISSQNYDDFFSTGDYTSDIGPYPESTLPFDNLIGFEAIVDSLTYDI